MTLGHCWKCRADGWVAPVEVRGRAIRVLMVLCRGCQRVYHRAGYDIWFRSGVDVAKLHPRGTTSAPYG